MNRKISKSSLYLFFLFFTLSLVPINQVNGQTNVNILCFIEDAFGDSYYINKGIMESYNWTITTASSKNFVTGCKNLGKNVTDTYADILVDDISDKDLFDYDCIFVPSGGHVNNIMGVARVTEIIQKSHEEGILIAGICTGMIMLAYAGILDGVDVAYSNFATEWIRGSGANITTESVVSDQGIITGGFGGGVGQGPEGAPNEDFCEKIKEEIELHVNQSVLSSILVVIVGIITISIISVQRKYAKRRNLFLIE
ncbi:hypothetical protein ES705_18585 [subsurface metagenome]|jgi:putative intracellular protease/amidase